MEQLQLAVMLWSSIGIAACMAVLCLLGWNKKRNPNFLTSRFFYHLRLVVHVCHRSPGLCKDPHGSDFSRNRFHRQRYHNDIVCLEKKVIRQPLK